MAAASGLVSTPFVVVQACAWRPSATAIRSCCKPHHLSQASSDLTFLSTHPQEAQTAAKVLSAAFRGTSHCRTVGEAYCMSNLKLARRLGSPCLPQQAPDVGTWTCTTTAQVCIRYFNVCSGNVCMCTRAALMHAILLEVPHADCSSGYAEVQEQSGNEAQDQACRHKQSGNDLQLTMNCTSISPRGLLVSAEIGLKPNRSSSTGCTKKRPHSCQL